jgi:hypothetical protein
VIERSVDVSLQIDSNPIGSGTIVYLDDSAPSLTELKIDRCVSQQLCFNNTCFDNAVDFCYTDTIASDGGGLLTTTLSGDAVFKETGDVIGSFTIPFTDIYSSVTVTAINIQPIIWIILLLLLIGMIIIVLMNVYRASKEK